MKNDIKGLILWASIGMIGALIASSCASCSEAEAHRNNPDAAPMPAPHDVNYVIDMGDIKSIGHTYSTYKDGDSIVTLEDVYYVNIGHKCPRTGHEYTDSMLISKQLYGLLENGNIAYQYLCHVDGRTLVCDYIKIKSMYEAYEKK